MRVVVDAETCEATGFCQEVAGAVFRVGEDDHAVVLVGEVPPELEGDVREAALLCPTRAIEILED